MHTQFTYNKVALKNGSVDYISFSPLAYEEFIRNIPQFKLIVYPSGGHLLIHHHG